MELKLLKNAVARIESNREFMAYFLKKYAEIEGVEENQLAFELNCSLGDYYKLALCKAPEEHEADFDRRIDIIGKYTNTGTVKLKSVIKQVSMILRFAESRSAVFQIAARDRKPKNKNSKDESE